MTYAVCGICQIYTLVALGQSQHDILLTNLPSNFFEYIRKELLPGKGQEQMVDRFR